MTDPHTILAVLAGGRAQRMGGDKAAVPLAGRPLISHPLAAGREAGMETVVVAKRTTRLPPLDEALLLEPDEPSHPLCGMLAALDYALSRSPSPGVLFVACDMPFLTAGLLRAMADIEGAVLIEVGGHVQPLPARVEVRHRATLIDSLDARSSLRAALGALEPRLLSEAEVSRYGSPQQLCASVNSPAELALAEIVVAGSP
jgi:molybdopterin-guanine dinucleotide biosynthesis protein A